MRNTSRSKAALLNTVTVFITTILNVILGMVEMKLLITEYGSTVNGVMQTGNQLLSYVSLIEAGIGASFLYRMYKPVADKDLASLSSLYCGLAQSMRKAVIRMMAFAISVSVLYPFFLNKDGLSHLYISSIFILLSMKCILPYLLTIVPKYMIILAEQRYKAEIITGTCKAVTYLAEILLLLFTDWPLQVLLIACVTISIISGLIFRVVMRTIYGKAIDKKAVPDFSPQKMSKDVFVHNVSNVVFNSTANIMVSLFSLSAVTIYSNYNHIVSQVVVITQGISNGLTASVGIKIANKDKNVYDVFREIFSIILCFGCIVSSVFMVMVNDFITLWVGAEFCVEWYNILMFGIILYCGIVFQGIIVARDARGLYKESRNFTILQAVINLIISGLLVPFYGITGVLLGTVIARVAITIPMNYRLIYKEIFIDKKPKYLELLGSVCLSLCLGWGCRVFLNIIHINGIGLIGGFLVKAIITTVIVVAVSVAFYSIIDDGFRKFTHRLFGMMRKYNTK